MIKLDDNLLQELGLGSLPPEEKKKMLAHIYETLEMRVGMELAKQMTDAQLNEFEQFINRNDEGGALRWLETNFPNYKQVVSAEFDKLKLEIKQVAPQIVASSQQAQMQAGQQQPQQPPQNPGPQPPYQPATYPSSPHPYPVQTPQPQDNVVPFPQQPQQPMYPPTAQPPYPPQQQPYPSPYPPQQPPYPPTAPPAAAA